jgi:hypothetical protein
VGITTAGQAAQVILYAAAILQACLQGVTLMLFSPLYFSGVANEAMSRAIRRLSLRTIPQVLVALASAYMVNRFRLASIAGTLALAAWTAAYACGIWNRRKELAAIPRKITYSGWIFKVAKWASTHPYVYTLTWFAAYLSAFTLLIASVLIRKF